MAEGQEPYTPPPDRSRRAAIFATLGIVVIMGLVAFYLAVVAPLRETHSVVMTCSRIRRFGQPRPEEAIGQLGGQERASARLRLYLRLPRRLATARRNATFLLGRCGKAVVSDLVRLLDDADDFVSEEAARSLGDMGADGVEAVSALCKKADRITKAAQAGRTILYHNPDPVRAAYEALKKIRGEE